MRRANYFEELRQDLWQATRMLRNNAAFAITVVLMLALGIGANTAIFTLVDAVLLRKLPVKAPEELVVIGDPSRTSSFSFHTGPASPQLSFPLYTELRDNNNLVSGLFASGRADRIDARFDNSSKGDPDHPRSRYVSGNYFRVLGVSAQQGRVMDGSEDAALGAAPVVVISDAFWKRKFDSDPAVVGRSITLNGNGFTIIGVSQPNFSGEIVGAPTEMWIPLTMKDVLSAGQKVLAERQAQWLLLVGRRKPGVSYSSAVNGFTALFRRFEGEHRSKGTTLEDIAKLKVFVSPGERGMSRVRSTFAVPLMTLLAGVGLLLLIVCANVANLLLARSVARQREMTVRVAIGAGRARLVRQLLTESVLLALLGAAGGLALAWYASHLLLLVAGGGTNAVPVELTLDVRILAFTALASLLSVALFGLVPALTASRVDLASTMRANARSVTGGLSSGRGSRSSAGAWLISGQVALSLVLLVGAGLLVRSLQQIERSDTGLDRDHLLVVELDMTTPGYKSERAFALMRELTSRFERIPGVQAVTFSENGIFSGTESGTSLKVGNFVARTEEDSSSAYDRVGPNYVHAIGGRLVQGRDITAQDVEGSDRVVLINQSFANHYFKGVSPLGEFIRFDDSIAVRIVGVVADTRDHTLDGEPTRRLFLPAFQKVQGDVDNVRYELRATGDPALLAKPVRDVIHGVDPLLRIEGTDALSYLVRLSIREELLLARLSSAFGFLALLLASFGLYGVLTYAVTRRTGEIGLRVALGAQRSTVVRMILRDALILVAIGVIAGAPLSVLGGRLLKDQLHGVEGIDPIAIAVALTALISAAVLAALLPALRASRVAPLTALREN
ncbi:MAG: ABC transporter permease [Gemmatimonadaceae bacterium]